MTTKTQWACSSLCENARATHNTSRALLALASLGHSEKSSSVLSQSKATHQKWLSSSSAICPTLATRVNYSSSSISMDALSAATLSRARVSRLWCAELRRFSCLNICTCSITTRSRRRTTRSPACATSNSAGVASAWRCAQCRCTVKEPKKVLSPLWRIVLLRSCISWWVVLCCP